MPMSYRFTEMDYAAISAILGVQGTPDGSGCVWQMMNQDTRQAQIITLLHDIDYPDGSQGSAVIVQTKHGYFELHECSGYITFEPDEVIFITERGEYISGMVLGKQCTCSMFSPIQKAALHANFGELHPSLIMSAMQLSLAEQVLDR